MARLGRILEGDTYEINNRCMVHAHTVSGWRCTGPTSPSRSVEQEDHYHVQSTDGSSRQHDSSSRGNICLQAARFKFLPAHCSDLERRTETHLLTTILAIPNYRLKPTGETVINFKERPGSEPQALRAWFYPGDNFGQEFAYPKTRALELAQASNETVPAETAEPTTENLTSVPLVAVTPSQTEEPIAEAAPSQEKAAPEPTRIAEAEELPKTASPVPLLALLGFVSVGLGFGIRLLVRRAY